MPGNACSNGRASLNARRLSASSSTGDAANSDTRYQKARCERRDFTRAERWCGGQRRSWCAPHMIAGSIATPREDDGVAMARLSGRAVMRYETAEPRLRLVQEMEIGMLVQDAKFEGESLSIDGSHYRRCTFIRCTLVYSGLLPVSLENNNFDECQWHFAGPAQNTLGFLTALYAGGAQELVELTFNNIRSSSSPVFGGSRSP
jgi:hypothetical protein